MSAIQLPRLHRMCGSMSTILDCLPSTIKNPKQNLSRGYGAHGNRSSWASRGVALWELQSISRSKRCHIKCVCLLSVWRACIALQEATITTPVSTSARSRCSLVDCGPWTLAASRWHRTSSVLACGDKPHHAENLLALVPFLRNVSMRQKIGSTPIYLTLFLGNGQMTRFMVIHATDVKCLHIVNPVVSCHGSSKPLPARIQAWSSVCDSSAIRPSAWRCWCICIGISLLAGISMVHSLRQQPIKTEMFYRQKTQEKG